jgi:hypothetical protein
MPGIIADATRSMPHTLRTTALDDETPAEVGVPCGFDDDLAAQITATSNRIRGLLTQIHPALERALGPHLDHPAMADPLTRYPTPAALKAAGRGHVKARLKKHAPRAAERLTDAVFTALGEQTVVVVGTSAAGVALPKLAGQLLALRRQRDDIASRVEALVEAHPLHKVLASMPGIGGPDLRPHPDRSDRQTLRQQSPSRVLCRHRAGHPPLRRVHPRRTYQQAREQETQTRLFLSAFAALHHPPSGPTTTANVPKANATTRPSSPSPAEAQTSSSHAPRRNPPSGPRTTEHDRSRLTKTIEAPLWNSFSTKQGKCSTSQS